MNKNNSKTSNKSAIIKPMQNLYKRRPVRNIRGTYLLALNDLFPRENITCFQQFKVIILILKRARYGAPGGHKLECDTVFYVSGKFYD